MTKEFKKKLKKIRDKSATIGVVGLGYVGLPLCLAASNAGYSVIGIDSDSNKISSINSKKSYLKHIDSSQIGNVVDKGLLSTTTVFDSIKTVDVIIVCVPTPLTKYREPDLSILVSVLQKISPNLQKGQLVILESTTYPGTTKEVADPVLMEKTKLGRQDIFLGYSPEREDPGNISYETKSIPKVVGADDEESKILVESLYSQLVEQVIPVSDTKTAEMTKLFENIFRSVNIALVNEMKIISDAMGIDIWEVIDAAKTKPFGYMPFYPGPGLGGHCIPIDPFYLSWKAKEFGLSTRFIELAGEINTFMPHRIIDRLTYYLDQVLSKNLKTSSVLIVGLAYKKNVDDCRESPALEIINMLLLRGVQVQYIDPFIAQFPAHGQGNDSSHQITSLSPSEAEKRYFDAVLILTDHDDIDYRSIIHNKGLIVDTRNVLSRNNISAENIYKA